MVNVSLATINPNLSDLFPKKVASMTRVTVLDFGENNRGSY